MNSVWLLKSVAVVWRMMIDSDSFGILPIPKVATFRTFFKSQNVIANNRLCITCKIGHKKSYRNEMSCNFARILLFGARQQQTESPHYGLKILKKCKLGIIKLLFFSKDFLIGLFKNSFWTICTLWSSSMILSIQTLFFTILFEHYAMRQPNPLVPLLNHRMLLLCPSCSFH